jgi:hypothetical protein
MEIWDGNKAAIGEVKVEGIVEVGPLVAWAWAVWVDGWMHVVDGDR